MNREEQTNQKTQANREEQTNQKTQAKQEVKLDRIYALVKQLNEASKAYYNEDRELMSNFEYDALYDELVELQKETGVVPANSPTEEIGYEIAKFLPEEAHEQRMLSLDKTKDVEALKSFVGNQKSLLSWKMDGLTVVLTYRDGVLAKAVTRGNGAIGEVVTANAKAFRNLPKRIPFQGKLILRGEAIIHYSDFNRINESLAGVKEQYKNPRNLCSGAVRQLNSKITAERSVYFYTFAIVQAEGVDFHNSYEQAFQWVKSQGFTVVEYVTVTAKTLEEQVGVFSEKIKHNDFPSDGLVVLYDDIAYGESLGTTAKFPRNALAFKWADEQRETVLREIEWSPSRTGLLNPVAIFDPVELEGTSVSRASVHNVSILKSLALGIGDHITVYKANMIIPQIADNLTRSGNVEIPKICPVCQEHTKIETTGEVETLYCANPDCAAKHMKAFTLFVSRDAMDMEGLSEATLKKLMGHGILQSYADLFRLSEHQDTIMGMEGFGKASCENLLAGIEKARKTHLSRFLYALGIPCIGVATAKVLAREFKEELSAVRNATAGRLCEVEGIGEVIAGDFVKWWKDPEHAHQVDDLLTFVEFEPEFDTNNAQILEGLHFVVTGSLVRFANRKELQTLIERFGGKVTGSVSANTTALINNDVQSTSSKNKKARSLGIEILSEEDFLAKYELNSFTTAE